jgi:hypothetical protein
MKELAEWESRETIIKEAKNYNVTARQLARWHYEGLLLRPKQYSLGRGKGTQTLYPPGTTKQVLALCEIRKSERRLGYVAWKLWWQGYNVDILQIHKFIAEISKEWQHHIENFELPNNARIRNKSLRKALRRVENPVRLKSALPHIVTGKFDPNLEIAEDIAWDMEEALGLEPGNTKLKDRPRLNKETLFQLSHLIEPDSLLSVLPESSTEELMEARDYARLLLLLFEGINFLNKEALATLDNWVIKFGALIQGVTPDTQIMTLLFLRKMLTSEMSKTFRQDLQIHKEALESFATHTANYISSLPNQQKKH